MNAGELAEILPIIAAVMLNSAILWTIAALKVISSEISKRRARNPYGRP
jgi:hypothetical protein